MPITSKLRVLGPFSCKYCFPHIFQLFLILNIAFRLCIFLLNSLPNNIVNCLVLLLFFIFWHFMWCQFCQFLHSTAIIFQITFSWQPTHLCVAVFVFPELIWFSALSLLWYVLIEVMTKVTANEAPTVQLFNLRKTRYHYF